jgi:hypothetical protein
MTTEIKEVDYQTRIVGTEYGEFLFVDRYSDDNEVWINANVRGGNTRVVLSQDEAKKMIEALTRIVEAS